MNEARPFASLSSGLLARKGAARPAMRPQGFGPNNAFEDLGWNDMGAEPVNDFDGELPEHVPSSISALTPAPKPVPQDAPEPEVIAQQRAIAESFAPDTEVEHDTDVDAEAADAPTQAPVETPSAVVSLPRRAGSGAGREGQEGRLHAARRCRSPSSPPPRHRHHRPVGAAIW